MLPMEQIEIARQKATPLAEKLKSLACMECVRGWINVYEGDDPLKDTAHCAELGLISDWLQKRLTSEVKGIQT